MPCPRTQQANLPACSPQPPLNAERQAGKLRMPFIKVFWYDSTRGMKPRSTDCEADALTTTPSRRYGSVSTRLVFTSKRMLPVAGKDVLPVIQKSFVIYEYKCHCDSRYVGRTSQRLQDRIKQHVPQWLRQQLTRPRRSQPHRSCKRTDTKPDVTPPLVSIF